MANEDILMFWISKSKAVIFFISKLSNDTKFAVILSKFTLWNSELFILISLISILVNVVNSTKLFVKLEEFKILSLILNPIKVKFSNIVLLMETFFGRIILLKLTFVRVK